jgi:predicted Zn-dependent protease
MHRGFNIVGKILGAALLALLTTSAQAREYAITPCPAEIQRARDTMAKIFREWPLRPSGDRVHVALQAFTTWMAERAGEQNHRHWRTHVIRDHKLNAFSIGDGHIFVTEGMLRFVESEAELATVLTHEFAHHLAGDFCQSRKTPGFIGRVMGNDARSDQRQVGTLTAAVDPAKEREADRISTYMLERAGYNPQIAALLAARMSSISSSEHFQYRDRIVALQTLLKNRPPVVWASDHSTSYAEMKAGLSAN